MKIGISRVASLVAALAVSALWATQAHAQDATVVQSTTTASPATAPAPAPTTVYVQPAPVAQTTTTSAPLLATGAPVSETRTDGYAPNTILLASGLFVFGVPYVSSVIVAAASDHPGDHHLYVPLAGPWIDMANRGGCNAANNNCDGETTNKVLLGVDGVFQAIGAIEIVSAFLSPERREVTRVPATAITPSFTLQPVKVGGSGYGFGAFGQF